MIITLTGRAGAHMDVWSGVLVAATAAIPRIFLRARTPGGRT